MASFTTVIKDFSESEHRKTYSVSGHTVQAPKLVIVKRSVPASATAVGESHLMVVFGTADAEGNTLQSKVVLDAGVRYPANGQSADVTAALAAFRDFVASDEFTNLVNSQDYPQ